MSLWHSTHWRLPCTLFSNLSLITCSERVCPLAPGTAESLVAVAAQADRFVYARRGGGLGLDRTGQKQQAGDQRDHGYLDAHDSGLPVFIRNAPAPSRARAAREQSASKKLPVPGGTGMQYPHKDYLRRVASMAALAPKPTVTGNETGGPVW